MINKFSIIFIFLVYSTNLYGLNKEYIKWHWDYEKGLRLAKQQNKNIIFFLKKKNDKNSLKMLKTTLCHKPYIKELNKRFIFIIATFEGTTDILLNYFIPIHSLHFFL